MEMKKTDDQRKRKVGLLDESERKRVARKETHCYFIPDTG